MRALLIVAALAATAAASPPPLMHEAPIVENCSGPSTDRELTKCIAKYAPTAKITSKMPSARIVAERYSYYLYVMFEPDRWQYVWRMYDANYELASDVMLSERRRRIDVRHFADYRTPRGFDRLIQRITLVCALDGHACTTVITGCRFISRGRALETFIGDIAIGSNGEITVEGDRSQAESRCRS